MTDRSRHINNKEKVRFLHFQTQTPPPPLPLLQSRHCYGYPSLGLIDIQDFICFVSLLILEAF